MSLLPFLFDYEYDHPRRLIDQHFGLGLTPDDLLSIAAGPLATREYYRPWRHLAAATRDVGSSIKSDKDKFQVNLDVQHFSPEEISVKTADGYIVVEGKHEEKKDQHGYISRQFTRRYALPEGCTPETVESKLSSDGVLTVVAPKKVPPAVEGERKVPITQTGPVRKEVKEQSNGDKAENSVMQKKQEEMQNKMKKDREVQMAMQIARTRDVTLWITTFYAFAATAMFAGYRKTKNKAVIAPMLPLTFVTLYYWDLSYGNKLHRIRMEAQHILSNEPEILELPTALESTGAPVQTVPFRSGTPPGPRLKAENTEKPETK
ncbi:hypothetical protein K1T71_013316 [Dendrolimus kikuchii]|uniref:Uncharacterized protein n=1 Tax=Dendrolimus kikuchii TaxID=765133 RepID=A0ACC1CI09_9NEOP|nr:hypothetical protein K1T71_013316 [Dendrolimus kikuchii]